MGTILVKKESFSHLTKLACHAAVEAGGILRQGFNTQFSISSKEGVHNLVTEYDYKAEKAIISFLQKEMPQSSFLAEEGGASGEKGEILWIIDPLDGTVNFAHRIPLFAVSIGVEVQGEVVSGAIYLPLFDELFVAEKGKGAFLNDQPIHASSVSSLNQAILSTGFPYNLRDNPFQCIDHFLDVLKVGIPIRRLGSAAIDLAYTAAGRIEGFFEVGLEPWDSAAGALLVKEAKGKISHWDETPFSPHAKMPILATNGKIHDALSTVLQRSSQ